ncbi:MAG: hypothetical protein LLG04_05755 [Parachlamydia sp.]|nr:hypothetical protein [Parachlamydia sp.]
MCLPIGSRSHETKNASKSAAQSFAPKEGNALCMQMEKIADIAGAFSKAMNEAKKNGTRWACAGVSLVAGLNQLRNGNLFSGVSMTSAGGLELIKLVRGYRDYPQLTGLLENAGAGTKMIKVLDEANKKTEKQIKAHLKSVEKGLEQLEKSRKKIEKLAKSTDGKLQERTQEARQLIEETESAFAQAREAFERSKEDIGVADLAFVKTMEGLQELIELANSPLTEETPQLFKEKSDRLFALCSVGHDTLDKAIETIEEGQQFLDHAIGKLSKAKVTQGAISEAAKKGLKEIELEAQNQDLTKDCQKHLKEAKKHQQIAEERRQEQMQIFDDIGNMQREADQGRPWGLTSILSGFVAAGVTAPAAVIGGGAAAGTAALSGAPIIAVALGAGALMATPVAGVSVFLAVHNRHAISDKLHDMLYGSAPAKTGTDYFAIRPEETQAVRFAFDKKSSGIWGKWMGTPEANQAMRESRTQGDLSIDLGNGQGVSYRVHLGQKEAIKWDDLMDLRSRLLDRLKDRNNPLCPQECRRILNALEDCVIERGSKHRARVGLIKKDLHIFGDVRRVLRSF